MLRVVALFIIITSSTCFATWQKLAQLNAPIGCCFFLDGKNGFVGSGSYGSNPVTLRIWATRDGGITWIPCGVPSETGQITQISIDTNGVGYASVFCMSNPSMNLWRTQDGGFSWVDASTSQRFGTGVGIKGAAFATASWNLSGSGNNGVFFMENATQFISPGPQAGNNANEAWSAYGDATTRIWYQVKEMARRLYASTDRGATWSSRFIFNLQPTGHIDGADGTVYIQTQDGGMLRSTDAGFTWAAIGGPSNYVDTRSFWVGGCTGREVIAFDVNGGVWKTSDGGDGRLGTLNPISIVHITIPQVSACSVSQGIAKLIYTDCGEFIITSAAIENDPNAVFSLQPFTVPDTLRAGDTVTFIVDFDPKGNPLAYSAQIRIKAEQVRSGIVTDIDSLVRINAIAVGVPPKLTSSHSAISFSERSVCEPSRDTVITIRNEGCDTLTITNGPTSAGLPFTISTIPLPYSLPPDSTVTFTISYDPETGGAFTSSTRLQATSQGRQQEIEILLDAKARWGEGIPLQSAAALQFKTISICASDSIDGFITNTGCDTLIIDSTLLSGDADFSMLNSILSGQKLRPGDTIRFTFHLTPVLKGSRTGMFTIFLHNEHGVFPPMTGQFSLIGNVLDGTRTASQSLTSIDFGPTDLCSERDSVFTIRNTGCDTIEVTPALQGTGFELESMTITLAPGESQTIIVRTKIDTAGGTSQSVGLITFTTNAANGLTPIQLKRDYQYPRYYGVNFRTGQSQGSSGNIVMFEIVGESGLGAAGSGIHTLEATLDVNEDLLFYLYARGPNTVTRNGDRFTITHPLELQATPGNAVAELYYEVYLTKDTITDITISDFVFNGGDTSPCPLRFLTDGTLGNATPTFSYVFNCGDRTLHKFLEGTSVFSSISIRPNPAREEVTLEVTATADVHAVIDMYNAFGVKVASRTIMVSGLTKIPIDLGGFSSGQYFVRVLGAGASPVVSFIKQ